MEALTGPAAAEGPGAGHAELPMPRGGKREQQQGLGQLGEALQRHQRWAVDPGSEALRWLEGGPDWCFQTMA
ncbi:hypothetical protein HaLaN_07613 [Haematococcus lacustris]|uniref:Uncharacterized protein n=1 Tax=Haematococcus lacustris TaxID=44745 RepID=A0A699YQW2_HAELA|nr:hypothetical protein HaLaN_07613 [Haematococcus lacustris]